MVLVGFLFKTAQTTQTAQILLENRSNRSYLEGFLSGTSTRVLDPYECGQKVQKFDPFSQYITRSFHSDSTKSEHLFFHSTFVF